MARVETAEPESFVDGPIDGVIFRPLETHADERGWLVELYREDELPPENHPVMAYVSQTLPGVARGPHHHLEQSDYFAFIGPGEFLLYLWDIRVGSPTRGRRMKVGAGATHPQTVIIPPGVVHAYKNTGEVPGWVFNAANRLYAGQGKRGPVAEVRHEQRRDSPYRLD
jgi:dTDP-4-dehydrorhamnose 3,5-epimerase